MRKEYFVQLNNDIDGRNILNATIETYYKKNGSRSANNFLTSIDQKWGWFYTHFLLDRKIIVRYGIGEDRGMSVGGVRLAIGPHYFNPADFWSYEHSQRFRLGTEIDDINHNLGLLDEFFGYPDALKTAHGWSR
jgi:hypothetical protein